MTRGSDARLYRTHDHELLALARQSDVVGDYDVVNLERVARWRTSYTEETTLEIEEVCFEIIGVE